MKDSGELNQLTSMTGLMKSLARKVLAPKKQYKFTGNRAMAKKVRGAIVTGSPSYYQVSIVKSRIVKSKPWSSKQQKVQIVKEHLKYLQRDDAAIDGEAPNLFNSELDKVDSDKFAKQIAEDRHHFRFIISPEHGAEVDLVMHARELINDMESDLGLKLNWAGVIHKNTDKPHIHIVIRGIDNRGKDLIIKPDYISHGIRARSSELLTLELGPRSELSIRQSQRKALVQNKAIALDFKINEIAAKHNYIFTPALFSDLQQVNDANLRLKHLQSLNIVSKPNNYSKGFYQLPSDYIKRLKDLEAQHDIYKRISRFGLDEARQYMPKQGIMVGKILNKGLIDELSGTYYLIVDGADGNKWYVDLTKHKNVESLQPNKIVTFDSKKITKHDPITKKIQTSNSSRIVLEPISSIEKMVHAKNITLLDKYIVKQSMRQQLAHLGFGAEIRLALEQREKVLADRKLGFYREEKFVPVKNLFKSLRDNQLEISK